MKPSFFDILIPIVFEYFLVAHPAQRRNATLPIFTHRLPQNPTETFLILYPHNLSSVHLSAIRNRRRIPTYYSLFYWMLITKSFLYDIEEIDLCIGIINSTFPTSRVWTSGKKSNGSGRRRCSAICGHGER